MTRPRAAWLLGLFLLACKKEPVPAPPPPDPPATVAPALPVPPVAEPSPVVVDASATPDAAPPPRSKKDQASYDRAREAALDGKPEVVRSLLMPMIRAGQGDPEMIRLAQAACKQLHDQKCVDDLRGR
jgi:hypothetical protein